MTRRLWLLIVLMTLVAPVAAAAQGPRAANGAGPGLLQEQKLQEQKEQNQPIEIEAATLEVRDKSKMATFSGDVQVVQGDTTIKCQSLVVFYGAEHGSGRQTVATAAPQAANLPPGTVVPQGAHDIRRIEARGGVTVISKDQNASGDLGVYDLKKKTITLTGNVIVSQGKNVLRGDRVVVDTTTGNAHIESGATSRGRVRALIEPGKGGNGGVSNFMAIGPNRQN